MAKRSYWTFDRWNPTRGRTIAFSIFKDHQSSLNHLYWAHEAAFRLTFSKTQPFTPNDRANALFPNPTGKRRRDISLGEWADDYNAVDNWIRLSAVVASAGYLEVYVKTVIEAACQSCPGVFIGLHQQVDGVSLLKARQKYTFAEELIPLLKGEWPQRVSEYRKLFGRCPAFIENNLADLEQMRQLRNSVGHAFGRKLAPPVIGKDLKAEPFHKVKEERMMKYLALVKGVAEAIEAHLCKDYVGCYETLCVYHWWAGRKNGKENEEAKAFGKHFHAQTGDAIAQKYVWDLMTHYHLM